jgi:hypothetical protein
MNEYKTDKASNYPSKPLNQNNLSYFSMGRPGASQYGATQDDPMMMGYRMAVQDILGEIFERLGLGEYHAGAHERYTVNAFGKVPYKAGAQTAIDTTFRSNVVDISDRIRAPSAAPKESTSSKSKAA